MAVKASLAWLEAQYNNRVRVTDSAQILQRWAAASALVRERSSCVLDVAYGPGPRQRLDVFMPTAVGGDGGDGREGPVAAKAPVLVVIPGGYWRALSKADYSFMAASFVDAGALVVIPSYDLCPAVSIERIALQMTEALAWLWRHVADYGGDPHRITLLGHSAGGHLAAMLSCCDWKLVGRDLPRQLVRAAVSVSGLHELEPLRKLTFLQDDLRLSGASARRLSPACFDAPPSPQVLWAVCGADESEEYRRQNRLIQHAWGRRAVPVCEELPGCNHFTVMHELANPQVALHQRLLRLLGLRWVDALP
jgi:arylformamidase